MSTLFRLARTHIHTPRTHALVALPQPQRRGLRVRPHARRAPPGELQRLPPGEVLTLSDGTTVRVQGDASVVGRGARRGVVEEEEKRDEVVRAKAASAGVGVLSSTTSGRDAEKREREDKMHTSPDTLTPSSPSRPLATKSPSSPVQTSTSATAPWNWYFETLAPSPPQTAHAATFFATSTAKLLHSAATFRTVPESDVPEVCFIGRSNAGKSSLLNALLGLDTKALLARTSRTPGFTTTMNMYGLGPLPGVTLKKQPSGRGKIVGRSGLTVVDMPGYGEGSLSAWGVEIMKYIQSRRQLRRVFVLLDASHGVKDKDRSVLASLRLAGVSHQVVLSKLDKLYIPDSNGGEVRRFDGRSLARLKTHGTVEGLREKMKGLLKDIKPPIGGGALGEVLACSSEVKIDEVRLGIDDVRFAVLKAVGLDGVSVAKGGGKKGSGKGKGKGGK
jgi:GTP-binding protein